MKIIIPQLQQKYTIIKKWFMINKNYFLLFSLIGLIVYFPKLFNGFVWDDIVFITYNSQIQEFSPAILFDNVFNSGHVYRQIPVIYFSFMYSIFGSNPAPFHIIQLILHVLSTSLIFVYLHSFFDKKLSFGLSMLFLVHPINAEAVLWINSFQSHALIIVGLSMLFIAKTKKLGTGRIITLGTLALICLATNETAIIYITLIFIYRYLFKLHELKKLTIMTIVVLLFYIYMRILAGASSYFTLEGVFLAELSFFERILNIPAIFTYYLKILVYPIQLAIWQTWYIKEITFINFYLPLFVMIILFITYILIFLHIYKKQKKMNINATVKKIAAQNYKLFVFFSLWFFLCMGTFMQILPLEMTVSDRWFYIPFVGLLGMLAIILQIFYPYYKKYAKYLIIFFMITLMIFSLRTFVRAFDWRTNMSLYEHDVQYNQDGYFVVHNYAAELMHSGRQREAIPYIQKLVNYFPESVFFLNELGTAYEGAGDKENAIVTYKKSIAKINGDPSFNELAPYVNLARIYLNDNNPEEALKILTDKLLFGKLSAPELIMLRTTAYLQLKDYDKALKDITIIYTTSNDPKIINFYNFVKEQKELNK